MSYDNNNDIPLIRHLLYGRQHILHTLVVQDDSSYTKIEKTMAKRF